jgi:hypothetical protein
LPCFLAAVDLSLWKLQLPVNDNWRPTGDDATEIYPVRMSDNDNYRTYATMLTGGILRLYAPVRGATTPGSDYPRSELREMTTGGDNAAWDPTRTRGTLRASLAVTNLYTPRSSGDVARVTLAQIKGPGSAAVLMMYYDAEGSIYFRENDQPKVYPKSLASKPVDIPLGQRFDYLIVSDTIRVSVTITYKGVAYKASWAISNSRWSGKRVYFKTGAYGQGNEDTGTGGCRVLFYQLPKPTHP